ncbi:MAG: hypothetical protein CMM15_10365 [Rhodospirillaceae bacterium]|nr:hypothetical protein [Rhodospirillaceae bacterium]OUX67970.1 MAG: hypothetical protein CBD38_00700 [bacterium TMED178]
MGIITFLYSETFLYIGQKFTGAKKKGLSKILFKIHILKNLFVLLFSVFSKKTYEKIIEFNR